MAEIRTAVTPESLKRTMLRKNIPNKQYDDSDTYELAESYAQIPTEDLTLQKLDGKVLSGGKGIDFYGPATGDMQGDKLLVKALALQKIHRVLSAHNIKSQFHFDDVEPHHYQRIKKYAIVPLNAGNVAELPA